MIEPEILEVAEYDEYYEYEIDVAYEVNMNKNRIREESPDSYEFIKNHSEHFIIENNILKPKYDEIIVKTIEDGHHIGYGPNEKVFDVNMVVYVNGELELNEDHTEVVNGEMKVDVIFER